MIITPLKVDGAFVIDLEPRGDERGFFARAFCQKEFAEAGLVAGFVQANTSGSTYRGTLRGMHYQLAPKAETKMVRCIRGAVWDCALDLRPDSPTYGRWDAVELTAENRRMIYVPKGCAHGFLTLVDHSEVFYMVDEFYDAELERGVRWDDPRFGIEWPETPTVLSERDRAHPHFA